MFATIVLLGRVERRSAFFDDYAEAIEYAERLPGIRRVEEIGVGTVWECPNQIDLASVV